VHIGGIFKFMDVAKQMDYKCVFLGPAIPVLKIIKNILILKPDIVGLSYRLTPATVEHLLETFFIEYRKLDHKPTYLYFAGTQEVVKIAKKFKGIDRFFIGGESKFDILNALRNEMDQKTNEQNIPTDLISRLEWKKPFPLIRAHFGLPQISKTVEGIRKIANAKVLDVISIAPDQNTQSHYFHPEERIKNLDGAGGVPLRLQEDFKALDRARLTGNSPLLRIYAGTRDFIKLAKLYRSTIKNAWAAIPIFWFNQMDGRGPLTMKESIKQHIEAIKWHGENNIPVEINDSHQWSLRDAPDAIAVADMYLCGIIAKTLGVRTFVAQYMFNTPPSISLDMDLAKMLAKDELLQSLVNENFSVIKQVRTGLASFPMDLDKAKGQLAAATMVQLELKPDIVHVVSFSEANHAALPEDIIESCKIVDHVIDLHYSSNISVLNKKILDRKTELMEQAKWIVNLIPELSKTSEKSTNPFTNYENLLRLIELGIFDAPQLKNNKFALGKIKTKVIDGTCYSWDEDQNKKITEVDRIKFIVESDPNIDLSKLKFQFEKTATEVFDR
jgi:hypothetical protein